MCLFGAAGAPQGADASEQGCRCGAGPENFATVHNKISFTQSASIAGIAKITWR
jgi:hypothetical protein